MFWATLAFSLIVAFFATMPLHAISTGPAPEACLTARP
jgi:hypothetical protein